MKVSEMLNRIEYLRGLRTDVANLALNAKGESLDTDHVNTLEDAADAIDAYIDELLRKNVTM